MFRTLEQYQPQLRNILQLQIELCRASQQHDYKQVYVSLLSYWFLSTMLRHKLSLTSIDLEDYSDISPQFRDRKLSLSPDPAIKLLPIRDEPSCRICLEPCPSIMYCNCKGSSMLHIRCLQLYIIGGQGSIESKSRCEICRCKYQLILNKKCVCSSSNCMSKTRGSKIAVGVFSVYVLLVVIYIAYCCYLNSAGSLDPNLQVILLIMGISLVMIMLGVGMKWLWVSLVITVVELVGIKRREDTKCLALIRQKKPQLNDTVEYL